MTTRCPRTPLVLLALVLAAPLRMEAQDAPAPPGLAEGLARIAGTKKLLLVEVDRWLPNSDRTAGIALPTALAESAGDALVICRTSVEELVLSVPGVRYHGFPTAAFVVAGPRCTGTLADLRPETVRIAVEMRLTFLRFLAEHDPETPGKSLTAEVRLERADIFARWGWWDSAAAEVLPLVEEKIATTLRERVQALWQCGKARHESGAVEQARDLLERARELARKERLPAGEPPFLDVLDQLVAVGASLPAVEQDLRGAVGAVDAPWRPDQARAILTLAWCLYRQVPEKQAEASAEVDRLLAGEAPDPWRALAVRLRELLDTAGR